MTSTKSKGGPRIIMLLGSMPPIAIGGAEMQAVQLYKQLTLLDISIKMISWGKLWHKKHGTYDGVPFIRIKSILNIIIDVPSIFRRKKTIKRNTRIVYNDKSEPTDKITGKVWIGMILRYEVFYINCLIYLWIRRHQFDIIHVHMMEWPAIVGVRIGKRLNKPVVIKDSTMNGIFNILRYPNGKEKQKEIVQYAHCIAMTKMIRSNFLKAGIPSEKIENIPNGIHIPPLENKITKWNSNVIFVGNLTQQPAKGVDILMLAWKQVVKKHKATLYIVGNGDIESYKKFTQAEGIADSVIFLGRRNDVRDLLIKSDIFVLPSRREGMSNALMEAMLCSLPVVATRVSGSEDLIEDGVSGILVTVGDINELAKGIIFMLENEQSALEMGRMAYKSVAEKCNMEEIADKYCQFYNKILSNP